jgi:hypothetical protein
MSTGANRTAQFPRWKVAQVVMVEARSGWPGGELEELRLRGGAVDRLDLLITQVHTPG